ncbi:family 16 glycoside hydrolase [Dinghuibacter silviterrae]|uniref:Sugar phosphate isomerase/epimerase n=1 Tax=Dinghuibacter silviterrae TaxID=1539049 RepID=A0A4R8DHD1_9BACT|nr:family 16 glycoside hydrolase [Dinghuibacter silviterrae]TDW96917.1 sugar phosphate isomerase/epimerase [Dinghuibacter silviterrae]
MQKLTLTLIGLFSLATTVHAIAGQTSTARHPGVVSFTYRNQFAKDVPGTLDMIKAQGLQDIEFSSLFGQTPAALRKMLDDRGLYCSSYGVGYDDLLNKTDDVASAAKTLGAQYVRVAWIPHKGDFTLEGVQQAIADFNKVGKILKEKYGLSLIYHNHGYEFVPYGQGTLYDLLVTQTDPAYVNFELDVLWAYFPGQDPAGLLYKYPTRYKALHLKDLKIGIPGSNTGGTSGNNDVVLGTGQIDMPSIIAAAEKAGVGHYYIEDESDRSETQVPESIAFLKQLEVPNTLTPAERKAGWKLLFDGKTSDGWVGAHQDVFPTKTGGWIVRDGMITIQGSGGEEAKNVGDIVTTGEYSAFDLSFQFRTSRGCNSGVKYFVTLKEQTGGSAIGLEYQILDDSVHPDAKLGRNGDRTLASLYDLIPANKPQSCLRPIGEWNTGRIVVYPDNRVEHWLNGVKVLSYVRKSKEFEDLVAISKYKVWDHFGEADKGHILLQDHGFHVDFRSIKIKELK